MASGGVDVAQPERELPEQEITEAERRYMWGYQPGDRVMADGRQPVWTVRSYCPETGFYTLDGNIGGNYPAVRVLEEHVLWPAAIAEELGA